VNSAYAIQLAQKINIGVCYVCLKSIFWFDLASLNTTMGTDQSNS
jgi:hypothetical protein